MKRIDNRLLSLIAVATLAILPVTAAAQTSSRADEESEKPASSSSSATTTATTEGEETATTTAAAATPNLPASLLEFDELLDKHPPAVGLILKLDPTLFHNKQYMANYPALSEFIARHPEVPQNSRYYLQKIYTPSESAPRTPSERIWDDIAAGISIFATFLLVAGVLTWLIRTILDYRRWNRLSKVQAEVHNKLLDRFTSNEELVAYIQTPAGKRFLESAPIPLSEAPKTLGAPVSRVLWSLQIGVVLATIGLGLMFVSFTLDKEVAQATFAMAILAIFVGVGFVASAVMAYVVSRKLGLWQTEPAAAPVQFPS